MRQESSVGQRGINVVAVSGNVTESITFSQTNSGHGVCSFALVTEQKEEKTTFVRVNVFQEGLIKLCRDRLRKGLYVVVTGELMNRKSSSQTEVRAHDVVFERERQRHAEERKAE